MKEHECEESEGKYPFIKVEDDFTYTCQFCGEKVEIEEIL